MKRAGTGQFAVTMAHRVQEGAEVEAIALALASTWRGVDAALSPIIGKQGVAALYRRSVDVTALTHPSLETIYNNNGVIDQPALTAALATQDLAHAAAAGDALLLTFCDLLATLVGPVLADRLLDPVWSLPPRGVAAQDSAP